MKTLILAPFILFLLISSTIWADEIDDLIPAIIQVESGGNPNAVSRAGAIGLMQITHIVWKEYMQKNYHYCSSCMTDKDFKNSVLNPECNVRVGTWYLRRLKDHYLKKEFETIEEVKKIQVTEEAKKRCDEHKLALILAAYNGGITRLRKNNYDINKMPSETRAYVKKVMAIYKKNLHK